MATSKISVREFEKTLRTEMNAIAKDQGWNIDNASERGYAFQWWWAEVVASHERTYDTEPNEALLYSKDLKADIIMEDSASNRWLICQCKNVKFKSNVDETEVTDFFNRHELFMDRKWVLKYGSQDAKERLGGYEDHVKAGGRVVFYFVSTGKASERVSVLAEKKTKEYARKKFNVSCELFDFSLIKDYYIQSLSIEQSVPKEVKFDLRTGYFIEKDEPYPTVVGVLKGNALRNLAGTYKHRLFAWNIRGYLGNRGINQDIRETAQSRLVISFI